MNKEKEGLSIKTTIRLPKEQYKILKNESNKTKGIKGSYLSMNDLILKAVDNFLYK